MLENQINNDLRKAVDKFLEAKIDTKSMAFYSKSYANHLKEMLKSKSVFNSDIELQAMYVYNNIKNWKHKDAKFIRGTFKQYFEYMKENDNGNY